MLFNIKLFLWQWHTIHTFDQQVAVASYIQNRTKGNVLPEYVIPLALSAFSSVDPETV